MASIYAMNFSDINFFTELKMYISFILFISIKSNLY